MITNQRSYNQPAATQQEYEEIFPHPAISIEIQGQISSISRLHPAIHFIRDHFPWNAEPVPVYPFQKRRELRTKRVYHQFQCRRIVEECHHRHRQYAWADVGTGRYLPVNSRKHYP